MPHTEDRTLQEKGRGGFTYEVAIDLLRSTEDTLYMRSRRCMEGQGKITHIVLSSTSHPHEAIARGVRHKHGRFEVFEMSVERMPVDTMDEEGTSV